MSPQWSFPVTSLSRAYNYFGHYLCLTFNIFLKMHHAYFSVFKSFKKQLCMICRKPLPFTNVPVLFSISCLLEKLSILSLHSLWLFQAYISLFFSFRSRPNACAGVDSASYLYKTLWLFKAKLTPFFLLVSYLVTRLRLLGI